MEKNTFKLNDYIGYNSILYCTRCKKYIKMISYITRDVLIHQIQRNSVPFNERLDAQILPESVTGNGIRCKCNDCNKDVFVIDGPIYDIIIKLNEIGYGTSFSCAGHSPYENAYIRFASNEEYDEDVPSLTKEQRHILFELFNAEIENEEYSLIRKMTKIKYTAFNYNTEEFYNVSLDDDSGTLQIDFHYGSDREDDEIDNAEYLKCNALFLEFLSQMVKKLERIDKNEIE